MGVETYAEHASGEKDQHGLRDTVTGFGLLAAATLVGQVIGFVALTQVSRRIGPANLGAYTFVAALTVYFGIPSNFGVTALGARDVALRSERRREIVAEVLAGQIVIAIVAYGALLLLAPVIAPGHAASVLIPIVGLAMIARVLNLEWALQGGQRFGAMAVSRVGGQILYGIVIALTITGGLEGARRYALANILGFAAAALISLAGLARVTGLPRRPLAGMARAVLARMRKGLPLGFAIVMVEVYYSIDSVMLGYFDTNRAVGLYGAAYRIPLAVIGIAVLWIGALYPHAARLFESDPDRLRRQVGEVMSYAAVFAVAVASGAALLAKGLMPAMFGHQFADAALPFALLSLSAALVLVSVNFGNVLLACGDERRYAVGVTVGAVVNLLLNFALIPPLGPAGAATATIAAETIVGIYMFRRFERVLGRPLVNLDVLVRGGVATAAMALSIVATSSFLSPFARLGVGFAVFVSVGMALGLGRIVDVARRPAA